MRGILRTTGLRRLLYRGNECAAALCEACQMRQRDVLQSPCPDQILIGTRESLVISSLLFLLSPSVVLGYRCSRFLRGLSTCRQPVAARERYTSPYPLP